MGKLDASYDCHTSEECFLEKKHSEKANPVKAGDAKRWA
jgi:hypothetical protein